MALYPTLIEVPFIDINSGLKQKILKSNFDDLGKQQVKRKWLYPKRSIKLNYSFISNIEAREIEQFYIDRSGQYSAFTFIMPISETGTYDNEYIGTGDGSSTVFNLPCVASSVAIYIDNNIQTSGTNYVYTAAGGQDGVDTITFTVAPNTGTRITINFYGRLAIRCRFEKDLDSTRIRPSNNSFNSLSVELAGILINED